MRIASLAAHWPIATFFHATFKTLADRIGERAIVELVALMGHYHGTTALFAVDRYPLPDGAREEIERPM